ncbi:MAG TPA: hypothetical protein VI819_03640 [Patescibacteria group bacterium]|nr:hypothetical protein [Patescibacteria group bacterium]
MSELVPSDPDQQRSREIRERQEWERLYGTVYRTPEFMEFSLLNRSEDVRHDATEFRGFMIDQWYRRGESPNSYRVEQAITTARTREVRLIESIPMGNHVPTQAEKDAGLIAGKNYQVISPDALKGGEIRRDGQYWVRNGQRIGLFETNEEELNIYQSMGMDTDRMRPVLYLVTVVSEQEARAKREELALEIKTQAAQTEAWSNIAAKVGEQDTFATDLDAYVDQEFTRLGKVIVHGWSYREAFGAPPTREGFASFGDKAQTALEAFREVIDGKAVVTMGVRNDNGIIEEVTGVLPNPFAYKRNKGLMELTLKYVKERVSEENEILYNPLGDDAEKSKDFLVSNDRDNRNAALAGLLLLDHFDIDAASMVQLLQREDEISGYAMEGAFVDSFKLSNPTARRLSEYYGTILINKIEAGKRRDFPRIPGSLSLRLIPRLTTHFLEVTTVEVLAKNGRGEEGTIEVTLDQLAFGTKDEKNNRKIEEREGRRYSKVKRAEKSDSIGTGEIWEYELKGLGDEGVWDDISIVAKVNTGKATELKAFPQSRVETMSTLPPENGRKDNLIEIIEGTNSLPYELPKGLLERYALMSVYKQFFRTDYAKMQQDFQDPAFLNSLNKGISLGTKLLVSQFELSKDSVEQLEKFVRVSLLANYLGAVSVKQTEAVTTGEKPEQQEAIPQGTLIRNEYFKIMLAVKRSGFLKTTPIGAGQRVSGRSNSEDNLGSQDKLEQSEEDLLFELLERRDEAPLGPFDLNYFSENQEKELSPLFPQEKTK